MNIVSKIELPKGIKSLVRRTFSKYPSVNRVLFVDNVIPEEKTGYISMNESTGSVEIIIDLGNCLRRMKWYEEGMMFIPNVWCNLIETIFHEAKHAEQLEYLKSVGKEDAIYEFEEQLEEEANEEALEKLEEFLKERTTPALGELGWLGQEIGKMLNAIYGINSDMVDDEITIMGSMLVAHAMRTADGTEKWESPVSRASLNRSVGAEKGGVGARINGTPYLKAEEFFGLRYGTIGNQNRVVKEA